MDLGLKDKAAAVMASSDGLGRASALALAREGADVAICGRRKDHVEETAAAIAKETGRTIVPIVADVSAAHDVERFVNAAEADLRGLDILVTNAGGPPVGRFEDLTDEAWRAGYELTLMSNVRAIRAALPHLRNEGGGSVIGIASTSVKQPIENLLLSNAMRMGVAGLFKTLATEYAHENIRFNLVLPGMMATKRLESIARETAKQDDITFEAAWDRRASGIPARRIGDPQEFGDAVAWLASPRSAYTTGTVLQIDGGLVKSPL